jgi:hypothetical protein
MQPSLPLPFTGPRFKTGQRVPTTGVYRDQFGTKSRHEAHHTFPPAIGQKGACAWRVLVLVLAA